MGNTGFAESKRLPQLSKINFFLPYILRQCQNFFILQLLNARAIERCTNRNEMNAIQDVIRNEIMMDVSQYVCKTIFLREVKTLFRCNSCELNETITLFNFVQKIIEFNFSNLWCVLFEWQYFSNLVTVNTYCSVLYSVWLLPCVTASAFKS